jgi:hypothetical protein
MTKKSHFERFGREFWQVESDSFFLHLLLFCSRGIGMAEPTTVETTRAAPFFMV